MKSFFKSIIVFLLTLEAHALLIRTRPRVVTVTGSVGKTSAKDAIAAVLTKRFRVRASEKSFNSELGVPLTVLGLKNAWDSPLGWLGNIIEGFFAIFSPIKQYPELLVLEAGVDRPGDMRRLASWLSAEIVVFTRFPDVPVHVEFFESPEAVIAEKRFLKQTLTKDGTLVINADDPAMAHEQINASQKLVTFGFNECASVRGTYPQVRMADGKPVGMTMKIEYDGTSVPISVMGALGVQQLYPTLAACAVGIAEGMHMVSIIEALASYTPPPGRMRLIKGRNNSLVIDDSYNASPIALEAALETLKILEVPAGARKIAVLGDMMELGDFSVREHRKVGERVASVADYFIATGLRMKEAALAAREVGMPEERIVCCKDSVEAGEKLALLLAEGDVVLVKGSANAMRMERAVLRAMKNPEEAPHLLVRQEAEWHMR